MPVSTALTDEVLNPREVAREILRDIREQFSEDELRTLGELNRLGRLDSLSDRIKTLEEVKAEITRSLQELARFGISVTIMVASDE